MPAYTLMNALLLLILLNTLRYATTRDYCVIGAGPSGLQIGYFLERAGRDYMIYERDASAGWFYKQYPRHRNLISLNKRYTGKTNKEFNLRHDWNSLISDDSELLMTKYSKEFFPPADVLVKYLKDYAEKLKLKVQYHTSITNVSKNNDQTYTMLDAKGDKYACKYIIVSTGLSTENLPKKTVGLEHTIGYPNMSVNREDYEGKTILILGRGNSGFETAQHLLGSANLIHMASRGRVKFSWETHYVGDVRAVNCGPIDTYQLKSLDGQFEGDMDRAAFVKEEDGKIYLKDVHDLEIGSKADEHSSGRQGYDVVIRALGFTFDRTIFDKDIKPKQSKVSPKFPEIKSNFEFTSSPNIYLTGTAAHSLDFRKSAGGFIHGYRYMVRTLARYLEWKNHGVPWPHVTLHINDLLNHLIKRLNEASDIYQMFTVLCDVIVFRENDMFEYYESLSYGMVSQFEEHTGMPFTRGIVVNMEYGKNFSGPGSDPFREDRATGEAQEGHKSNFLHPVLYYYEGKIPPLVSTHVLPRPKRIHHMVEDFLAEWKSSSHHSLPLRWFIEYCTGRDMRKFYAESCFKYAMIGTSIPISCQQFQHVLSSSEFSQS